ncbi:p080 [Rhizobium phage 16-3]|uniref:p080 n=1 Tax=Rhizobium phage 16-3 TaxID=10704 RepID=UPI00017BA621|nr:p080 [Rhizobium phage 16-3]ABF71332.1 p080 [Rhizobium phage 16-3]
MGDKNFKWWAADSEDAEIFQGPYDSREEAIQVGETDFDGESFYVVEADKSVMSANIDGEALAERIMEELCDNNEECFGEDGPDDPWAKYDKPHRSLSNAIEKAVEDWLAAHPGKTWSFGTMRNGETIAAKLAA